MRRVVFVADDLGFAAGVDAGIARAAAAGNVREASLCVTGDPERTAAGLAVARAHELGVGLHLSLTFGCARTGRIAGVTDRAGRFLPLRRVLLACLLGRVDRDGVAREVAAQLQSLRELGVRPTHCNGHHHVHVFPVVREVAFAAMAQAGVAWTRLPDELPAARAHWSPAAHLLRRFARAAAAHADRHALRRLPFVGLATEARHDFGTRAARLAARLPDGDVEWMVHPREPDPELARLDPAGQRRPAADELRTLADPGLGARLAITPVRYADLA